MTNRMIQHIAVPFVILFCAQTSIDTTRADNASFQSTDRMFVRVTPATELENTETDQISLLGMRQDTHMTRFVRNWPTRLHSITINMLAELW